MRVSGYFVVSEKSCPYLTYFPRRWCGTSQSTRPCRLSIFFTFSLSSCEHFCFCAHTRPRLLPFYVIGGESTYPGLFSIPPSFLATFLHLPSLPLSLSVFPAPPYRYTSSKEPFLSLATLLISSSFTLNPKKRKTFKTARLYHPSLRLLLLLCTAALLLALSSSALHASVKVDDCDKDTRHAMSANNNSSNETAFPVPQALKPGDFDRMMAEADERWANRPRPMPRENDSGMQFQELKVCRLPNGGVSDGVRAQLEKNRLRREAEAAAKAEQERQQQAEDQREL